LPPLALSCPQPFLKEELSYFPRVLELNQQVIILATEVGRTAQYLRTQDATTDVSRKNHAYKIQALCHTLALEWEVKFPQY
jgi:hypothetical protein